MPNYCYNEMTIKGPKEDLNKFRELFKEYEYSFTYNAIIPMPKSLNIPESSEKNYAIICALYEKGKHDINRINIGQFKQFDKENKLGLMTTHKQFRKDALMRLCMLYEDNRKSIERYPISNVPCNKSPSSSQTIRTREELLRYGNTLIFNKIHYGFYTWYDWSVENWGVKWDASETDEIVINDNIINVSFTSPWGPPNAVLVKISKMFPKFYIHVNVDCEGTGRWEIEVRNGKLYETDAVEEEYEDYD